MICLPKQNRLVTEVTVILAPASPITRAIRWCTGRRRSNSLHAPTIKKSSSTPVNIPLFHRFTETHICTPSFQSWWKSEKAYMIVEKWVNCVVVSIHWCSILHQKNTKESENIDTEQRLINVTCSFRLLRNQPRLHEAWSAKWQEYPHRL